jgi:hypothetical protein
MEKENNKSELFGRQKEILLKFLTSDETEMLIVGGYASGKTTLGAFTTLTFLRQGCFCLMTRETEREIENTMLGHLFRFAKDEEREYMLKTWNKNANRIEHPSGGLLFYISLTDINQSGTAGYTKIAGYEFNFALIDEAWKIKEEAYKELITKRLRKPPIQKVLLLTNADTTPVGHWLHKRFAGKEERIYTTDNPFVDQKVIERNKKEMSQEEFELWIGKGWGQGLKSIYPLSEDNIVEMNKITLENKVIKWRHDRTFYAGIDWGIENFAFVLGAYDIDEEVLYLIDCWEFHRETIDDIVNTLKTDLQKKWKINFEKELYCVGDIEGKRKDWTGRTAYELFLKYKFRVEILDHIPLWDSIQLEQLLLKNKKIKILKQTDEINMSTDRIMNAYNSAYKIENNRVIKVNELQHIKDATRYLVWYVFKNRKKGSGGSGTSVYYLYGGGVGSKKRNS